MRAFSVYFKNFLTRSFKNPLAYLLHFGLPIAGFSLMFLLVSAGESPAFAGTQAIGLVIFFMMIQAVIVLSLTLRDREEGVLGRLKVSPAPDLAYALGNGAAALVVLAVQSSILAVFISFIFPVKIGISFGALLGSLAVYDVCCLGFGFLICSLSESSSGALMGANIVAMVSSLLGGAFFPVDFMSQNLRRFSFLFPQHWLMRALSQLKAGPQNAGASEAALSLLVLGLMGLFFLALRALVVRTRRA